MKFFRLLKPVVLLSILFIFNACDSNDPEVIPLARYENGFMIANEGPFQSGTGTVSFFDYTTSTVTNNVFQTVNSRPLGNILQSVSVYNKEVFMVVNNAGKVEVADAETFESTAVIDNLGLPRYFLGVNENKAYVSQWGNGFEGNLAVVDLNSYTVTDDIATSTGPGRMITINDHVYVTCSGGFTSENKVDIIDMNTDAVIETITVGAAPKGIVKDNNGSIWVLCSGKYNDTFTALEESGSLYKINPDNNNIDLMLDFNDFESQPGNLVVDNTGQTLYYTFKGEVYKMSVDAAELPDTGLFSAFLYGLGFDPTNGYLVGSNAGDFSSNGKIVRYSPETGQVVDEHTVGIIPNGGFYFNAQ